MSVNLFKILGTVAVDNSSALRGLKETTQGAESAKRGIENAGRMIGKACIAIGTAIGVIGISALRMGDEFNQAMGSIQAQTGASDKEIQGLRRSVNDLAMQQGRFSTREMTSALQTTAIYGRDTAEMLTLLEYGMVLANATGGELEDSVQLLSMALDKAGKDSSDAGRYMNVFAQIARETNLPITTLKQNIIDLAPTMNNWNIELEQAGGWLARLKQEGIYGKAATSGLAYVFRDLANVTPEMASRLHDLGVELFDTNGNFNDGYDVMNQLKRVMSGMTDKELAEFQQELFGANGATRAVLDALLNTADGADEFTARMLRAGEGTLEYGIAADMANKRTGGLSEAFGRVRNFADVFLDTLNDIIGAPIYDWISGAVERMGDFIERFREGGDLHYYVEILGKAFLGLIDTLGTLVGAILPLIMEHLPMAISLFTSLVNWISENTWAVEAFIGALIGAKVLKVVTTLVGGLTGALSLLTIGVGKVKGALMLKNAKLGLAKIALGLWSAQLALAKAAVTAKKVVLGLLKVAKAILLSPITLVVAAIAGLVAAFLWAWENIEGFREFFVNAIEAIREFFVNAWEFMGNVIETVWGAISTFVGDAVESVSNIIGTALETISTVWGVVWNGIKTVVETVWNVIYTAITIVVVLIATAIQVYLDIISAVWNTVWGVVRAVAETVWEAISSAISVAIEAISNVIETVLGAISAVWNTVWGAIRDFVTPIWEAISSTISTVFNGIKDTITNIINTISSVMSTVWNSISSTISTVVNVISSTISTVFNTISSTVSTVVNAISSVVTSTWTTIRTATTTAFNAIRDAIRTPINLARDAVRTAINAIRGFFNFSITWPRIPMPRFTITPAGWSIGDLLRGSIPRLGVEFNAAGGIMTSPTIFGMVGNNLQIGGEAGAEAILPLNARTLAGIGEGIARFSNFGDNNGDSDKIDILIEEIRGLRSALNFPIVLDSGTLVGQLGSPIDKELSRINVIRTRGVTV